MSRRSPRSPQASQRITPIFVPLDQAFSNSFVLFMFGALDPSRQGGRLPDVLSISDGVCESRFTRDQLRLGERLLVQAAALGITTLSSSGDLGFRGCFINRSGTMFPGQLPVRDRGRRHRSEADPTQPDRAPGRLVDVRDRPESGRRDRRRPERRVRPAGVPAGAGHQRPAATRPAVATRPRRRVDGVVLAGHRRRTTRTAAAGGSAAERAPRRH